jgi:carboxymethylenebutenolidase
MSPHAQLAKVKAGLLIAIAKDDDAKSPDDKRVLREVADTLGLSATITVYAGDHGWMVPDSPAYNTAAATKGEADLLALYGAAL